MAKWTYTNKNMFQLGSQESVTAQMDLWLPKWWICDCPNGGTHWKPPGSALSQMWKKNMSDLPPGPQDSSHHQDDITFFRVGESQPRPSFSTVTGRGDNPRFTHDCILGGVLSINPKYQGSDPKMPPRKVSRKANVKERRERRAKRAWVLADGWQLGIFLWNLTALWWSM